VVSLEAESISVNSPNPRIAIIDDDESVCRAVRRLVRSLGMDGETFSSGQKFIDMLEAMPSFDQLLIKTLDEALRRTRMAQRKNGSMK
jgi:PleD family two-component response regulator